MFQKKQRDATKRIKGLLIVGIFYFCKYYGCALNLVHMSTYNVNGTCAFICSFDLKPTSKVVFNCLYFTCLYFIDRASTGPQSPLTSATAGSLNSLCVLSILLKMSTHWQVLHYFELFDFFHTDLSLKVSIFVHFYL